MMLSTRHSPVDARLERWSRLLADLGPHERLFRLASGGVAQGWLAFLRSCWRELRAADVWVLPDPELHLLYPAIRLVRRSAVVVLDVHEDYRRTAEIRPGRLPSLTRCLVFACDASYRAAQRRGDRVVVASDTIEIEGADLFDNGNDAPDWSDPLSPFDRAIYIGDLTVERGADEIVALAREMPELHIDLVGRVSVDGEVEDTLASQSNITVHGEVPFEEAIALAGGCGIGLSLLQDVPPYRDAQATKLFDYASLGQFVIVTPLPGQAHLVRHHDIGLVLPSFHVDDDAARRIRAALGAIDADGRTRLAERSRACHAARWAVIEAQWNQICAAIAAAIDARSRHLPQAPAVWSRRHG